MWDKVKLVIFGFKVVKGTVESIHALLVYIGYRKDKKKQEEENKEKKDA